VDYWLARHLGCTNTVTGTGEVGVVEGVNSAVLVNFESPKPVWVRVNAVKT
jgi:hypothetical protein